VLCCTLLCCAVLCCGITWVPAVVLAVQQKLLLVVLLFQLVLPSCV